MCVRGASDFLACKRDIVLQQILLGWARLLLFITRVLLVVGAAPCELL
jgi:hypothetical protein